MRPEKPRAQKGTGHMLLVDCEAQLWEQSQQLHLCTCHVGVHDETAPSIGSTLRTLQSSGAQQYAYR